MLRTNEEKSFAVLSASSMHDMVGIGGSHRSTVQQGPGEMSVAHLTLCERQEQTSGSQGKGRASIVGTLAHRMHRGIYHCHPHTR